MNDDPLTTRRSHRRPMELQLTAMIDIFSMIVIFLILGSVFGASEMVVPEGMEIPRSISKEGAESAPRVTITREFVQISFLSGVYPIQTFQTDPVTVTSEITRLENEIRGYVQRLPAEAKTSGVLLNVIADRETPYENIFNVVKIFRKSGFETLLFVAAGEERNK
ncbi:MAG: hypothetical protein A2428_05285 [Bdellovibrionales bacterium RIFOXYC1_FULL_54_43]|nr:MAG: hypothetical protein A2428_05285 [Bdellovibrionales bacterium RIFOXYC1_FULL_54_43]OFZ84945.1 MAG: hypothetical protein A2603_05245 [Bdellovibrionales bacterium RIFOXYD1_FULL_55_31]